MLPAVSRDRASGRGIGEKNSWIGLLVDFNVRGIQFNSIYENNKASSIVAIKKIPPPLVREPRSELMALITNSSDRLGGLTAPGLLTSGGGNILVTTILPHE